VKDADTEGKVHTEGAILAKIYEPVALSGSTLVPGFVMRRPSVATVREIADLATRLVPVARVQQFPLTQRLDQRLDELRQLALLAGMLGSVALVLVSIGIFGVFAYIVQQRTREIGVRMALGARPAEIVRVIIGSSMRPIVIGLAVGLAAAFGESGLLRNQLYGLSPLDPVTYLGILVVLGAAALAALYVPARRAARVSPIESLRSD